MKIRIVLAAICLLTTAVAFAEGSGWTANVTITKLVATQNGGVNIRVSPDLNNCVSQSGYGPNYASLYPTHPGINLMEADLLAAYLSGTKVSIYLSDNTCTVGEIIVGGW